MHIARLAQLARASRLHREGQGFESLSVHTVFSMLEGHQEQQHEQVSPLARAVFDDLDSFEHHDGPVTDVERKEFAAHLLASLREVDGATYHTEINDLYSDVSEPVIIRRENPRIALDAVLSEHPIDIGFKKTFNTDEEGDDAYFNATHWDGAGDARTLRNPFMEGFSHAEGVVTVLGFVKGEGIVEHRPEHIPEKMVDDTIAYDSDTSISGTIVPADIRFMVARIPASCVPEGELTEDELDDVEDGTRSYIFRGLTFHKNGGASSEAPH